MNFECLNKRYFIIDQQIECHYGKCLYNPPSLKYASQIVNPFLTSRISAYHDKGLGF